MCLNGIAIFLHAPLMPLVIKPLVILSVYPELGRQANSIQYYKSLTISILLQFGDLVS